MLDQIKETTDFLFQQIRNYKSPETGIILGTGLCGLVDAIDIDVQIDY